ncbi:MAG: hypothetical protein NZ772_15360 [Cyanobacteria bacterium]|nr:hypothetical protein [Cyanobacteriota bacterium]MDW8202735.1 hypothetical protein [Cyanobacteriota bacterium SKYGB_h_bin112]
MADELRMVLELATDEELQTLTEILFRRGFNPLDYIYTPEPIDVQSQCRQDWLDTLEARFRFLAADGFTVLKGRTSDVTYRQVLIQVCRYLKIPYRQDFSTIDLESEIYLNVLEKMWKRLSKAEQERLIEGIQRSLVSPSHASNIPLPYQQDPTRLLLTGSGALAMSTVIRPMLLELLNTLARHTAGRGALLTMVARYGALRTALAALGPALWTLFAVDLGWRAIATNYGRVIPAVFALAQIRLTRTHAVELVH